MSFATIIHVQAFEVADEEHPKVSARGNAGAPTRLVIGSAEVFDKHIKLGLGQHGVEFGVEEGGGAQTAGQLRRGDEEFLLP